MTPARRFAGTDNPRQLRAINALLRRPMPREELDRVAGCSNGPELISNLRQRGLEIPCERTKKKDRDLFDCFPGVYFMTPKDRRLVFRWIDERDKLNAIKTIATDPTTTGLKRAKLLK